MNNVIYRNQPSYYDARPERWMLSNVWAWSELGFTFETATVRHNMPDTGEVPDDGAIELSFEETFGGCAFHDLGERPDCLACRARWGHD